MITPRSGSSTSRQMEGRLGKVGVTSSEVNERTSLRDEELLGLIVAGDDQALGALYDRYGRLVFSLAMRVVGDRFGAEEVTQDVFQIVWQQCEGFRASAGTVPAWMIGITRHRAIDRIRTRYHKSGERNTPIDDAAPGTLRASTNVEQEVVMRSDVQAALAELPVEQRNAIELAYYGGLSATEIASSLGTPVGTVKTRLRLGLSKLRAVLLPGWAADERPES